MGRFEKVKKRTLEVLTIPTGIMVGFLMRVFLSFTGWIRALLLTWGVLDGVISNHFYQEEPTFPYQILRYGRIVANLCGIINIWIPVVWNISDGTYSLMLYHKNHTSLEQLPRYGRIFTGYMLAAAI